MSYTSACECSACRSTFDRLHDLARRVAFERAIFDGHISLRRMQLALIKRAAKDQVDLAHAAAASAGKLSVSVAALSEFICLTKWDDGSTRKTGSVTIFTEEGSWKAWINDKDAARSSVCSAASLGALLTLIDDKLQDDSLEWRRARPDQGRAGKKG